MTQFPIRLSRIRACATLIATAILMISVTQLHSYQLPPSIGTADIGHAQIFSSRSSLDELNREPRPLYIWGAIEPHKNHYATRYLPFGRDLNRSKTIEWYRKFAQHLIALKCDGITPAESTQYHWGQLTPLEFSQVDYIYNHVGTVLEQAKEAGYAGLAIDNVDPTNPGGRCTILSRGTVVRLYSGNVIDLEFIERTAKTLELITYLAHAHGLSVSANIRYVKELPESFSLIAKSVDIVIEEQGFVRRCVISLRGNDLIEKLLRLRQVAKEKPIIIINQTCRSLAQTPRHLINWSIATYLLVRDSHTYLAITGEQEYRKVLLKYDVPRPLGQALGEPQVNGQLIYRWFENGLVVINTGSEALPFDIPLKEATELFAGKLDQNNRSQTHIDALSAHILYKKEHDEK